jgi:serine phosphatase RsbU (regulator of sigma subunit)
MHLDILRRVPLFSPLSNEQLAEISESLALKKLASGTVLLQEGALGGVMYILVDGEVEVLKSLGTKDERLLAVRGHGELFGEMSLFKEDRKHTASVRAKSNVEVLLMSKEDMDSLLQQEPLLAYGMMRILSKRLDQSENLTILDLREKNEALARAYQELKAAQEQLIEKERLEQELEVARRIQQSILPHGFPLCDHVEFGARMEPMASIGGDFYDVIQLEEDRFGIAIGDVTDHGVPAALFMALTATLLRVEATRYRSPRRVLQSVNQHMLEMNEAGLFVTMIYGVFKCDGNEFQYSRAGHELPLILSPEGEVVAVKKRPGQPLGLFPDPLIDEQRIKLPPGSTLMLYSDGVTDAFNERDARYGLDKLQTTLSQYRKQDASSICDSVWKSVVSHRRGVIQQDDETLLAAKFK